MGVPTETGPTHREAKNSWAKRNFVSFLMWVGGQMSFSRAQTRQVAQRGKLLNAQERSYSWGQRPVLRAPKAEEQQKGAVFSVAWCFCPPALYRRQPLLASDGVGMWRFCRESRTQVEQSTMSRVFPGFPGLVPTHRCVGSKEDPTRTRMCWLSMLRVLGTGTVRKTWVMVIIHWVYSILLHFLKLSNILLFHYLKHICTQSKNIKWCVFYFIKMELGLQKVDLCGQMGKYT